MGLHLSTSMYLGVRFGFSLTGNHTCVDEKILAVLGIRGFKWI